MSEQRTSPYGLWRYGNDFRKAAIAVEERYKKVGFMPLYFLLGQAIELFLKAFLFANGYEPESLRRKYGHNLSALIEEALHQGLADHVSLKPKYVAVIRVLNEQYQPRKLQYIETGLKSLPEIHILQLAAQALSKDLEKYCTYETKRLKHQPYR